MMLSFARRAQRNVVTLAFGLASIVAATPLRAQSDPGPLLLPFPETKDFELTLTATRFNREHIKGTDESFRLNQYEAAGRMRLTDKFPVNPALGFDLFRLNVDTENDEVPATLTDLSVGFASPIYQYENGWYLAGSVGAGYAGGELGDYRGGYYGKLTGIVGKEFGNKDSILVALSYDGNRTVFPDVPLPAVAYTKVIDEELELVLGFPFTTVRWRPIERLRLEATASTDTISGRVEYDLTDQVVAYGAASNISRAFRLEELSGNDRLLFEQRRAEAGLIISPTKWKWVGITVAAGYAYAQEFSAGFDNRDSDTVYKPSDAGYFRVGLVWRPN